MSVEGVPSVGDVAREMAPHILYGTLGEDLARASEAVHALYAPVIERIQALSVSRRDYLNAATDEAARYREALETRADALDALTDEPCDCEGFYTCNRCPHELADRVNDEVEAMRVALVEPKGQD